MPILDLEDFDIGEAEHTGGVTGSKRVKLKKTRDNYQLKPSIKDNKWDRRAKAGGTDRENLGEVIASNVCCAVLNTDDFEASPEVSLVYDSNPKRKRILVASKYLKGDNDAVKYKFELMSNLPGGKAENAIPGTIYLSANGDYVVRNPKDKNVHKGNMKGNLAASGIILTTSLSKAHLKNEDIKKSILGVLSKKGETASVRTLDGHIVNNTETILNKKKKQHVKFVDGTRTKANPAKGEFDISGPDNALLRKDIARGIAASILIGDHDVNPGNFVVFYKDGKARAARIDFGHAFNDLLNVSKAFGGQILNKQNGVLDFLNRKEVGGIQMGSPSKLWRDYPGLVPSEELAEAMREMANSEKLLVGLAKAKEEFFALYLKLDANNDNEGKSHLIKSLSAISENLTGNPVKVINNTMGITDAFNNIKDHLEKNKQQMGNVAKLMALQANIDNILKENKENITKGQAFSSEDQEKLKKLRDAYNLLKDQDDLKKDNGIQWIRTDANDDPHTGDFDSYLEKRKQTLIPQIQQLSSVEEKTEAKVETKTEARESKKAMPYLEEVPVEKARNIEKARKPDTAGILKFFGSIKQKTKAEIIQPQFRTSTKPEITSEHPQSTRTTKAAHIPATAESDNPPPPNYIPPKPTRK